MGIGWMEVLVILVVALLVLGPDKLPDVARNVGKSVREVQQALRETTRVLTEEEPEDARKTRETLAAQRQSAQLPAAPAANARPPDGSGPPAAPGTAQAQQPRPASQGEPRPPRTPR
ncbi:MAG: Sec-independent protein translocase protein TatB [Chloroflexota bacterium]